MLVEEGKARSFYLLVSFLFTLLVSTLFFQEFLYLWTRPFWVAQLKLALSGENLRTHGFMFTEVSEAIWLEVSLALLTTSFCLSPLVFYQGLSFFSPSWYHSQRLFYWKMGIALWLTSLGLILLSFLWLLPEICLFFLQFEFHVGLYFEPRIWSFLSFLWRFLFVEIFCWFSFVGINLWLEMYTIDLKQKKTRSLGWLMSLFLGALVSPPEVVFQLSLSLCFGLLYEFLFFLRLYRQNCYSKKYKNSKTLCKAS